MEEERRSRLPLILAALMVATVTCGPALRSDDLDCMEALEHLVECCPGVDINRELCERPARTIDWCGDVSDPKPGYTADESACIKRKSCAELVADNTCETAARGRSYSRITGWSAQCR